MTAPAILAVVLAARADAGVEEFVRLCVGVVAGGGELSLVEAGPGAGVLSRATALPDELERNLEGLAALGIEPRPVTAAVLCDLLRATDHVLRVADPARPGTPDLLVLDDALLESAEPSALLARVASAGQVLRA